MSQKWTGESRGSAFWQNLLGFFIKYGGRRAAYFIGYFVAGFYSLLPSVRKGASFYLKRRFPAKKNLFFDIYKLNLSFAKMLIDRAVFGIRGDVKIISPKSDQELCKNLLAKGKGLIIITAHCGCWQTAMSAFDFMEGEKYAVYHRNKKDIDKHAHELSGKTAPVNFIEPASFGGGAIEIMAALQKKAVVCIMGDRIFGETKNAVSADFLGGKIKVPSMPYRLAAASGAPVAIIFFSYKENGRVDSTIAGYFFVEDKGAKPENYSQEAEKFAKALEEFVQKEPYQLFNYFDMWS